MGLKLMHVNEMAPGVIEITKLVPYHLAKSL